MSQMYTLQASDVNTQPAISPDKYEGRGRMKYANKHDDKATIFGHCIVCPSWLTSRMIDADLSRAEVLLPVLEISDLLPSDSFP